MRLQPWVQGLITNLLIAFAVLSLPQTPPAPMGPLITESLSAMVPAELSLETLNSQYLQTHSSSSSAILATAKVQQRLGAPREEIEASLFNTLGADTQLDIKVKFQWTHPGIAF